MRVRGTRGRRWGRRRGGTDALNVDPVRVVQQVDVGHPPRVTAIRHLFGEWTITLGRPPWRNGRTPFVGDLPTDARRAVTRWVLGDAWVAKAGERVVYDLTVSHDQHQADWTLAVRSAEKREDGGPHRAPARSDLPPDVTSALIDWLNGATAPSPGLVDIDD